MSKNDHVTKGDIKRLGKVIRGNSTDIKKLETAVKTNSTDIKRLEKAVVGNSTDIKRLEKAVVGNSTDIKKLEKELMAFKWEFDQKLQQYQENTERMITTFKDEILSHIDPVVKELAASREEQTMMSHQINRHGEKLEDHGKRITHLEATC